MKKFYLLPALALTSMLAVTSCSGDDVPDVVTGGESSFTVRLPEDLGSRTFGDGQSATTLTYAVYEQGTNTVDTVGTAQFSGLQTTVKLNLPRGKHYDIIFWAQNPAAPYTFSAAGRNVSVTYKKGYSEDNDAFSYILKDFSITGATSTTVTLKRPFAQLNIGTTDYADATGMNLTATESAVTVKDVATTFDFTKGEQGEAVGPTSDAVFDLAPIPAGTEKFPVTDPADIKYMAMNYILVPADKATTSVTFNVNDESYAPFTFENVPLQRNYRTNIYGQLLTAPATFNVTIDPIFNEFKEPEAWDGTATRPAGFNIGMPENKMVYLNTPGELAWIIENAVTGNKNFEGYTFVLTRDFDLNGNKTKGYNTFKGTLDGQGHTIKGQAAALFYTINGGTVKNLVIDSANITSGGAIASTLSGDGLIENITVNANCTFKVTSDFGTVVGNVVESRVNNCVNNAAVNGSYRRIGGIVGKTTSGTITNCENNGKITVTDSRNAEGVGGIVGMQYYGGSVANCKNTGDVTVTASAGYGAGGIIGWIRYATGSYNKNGINNIVEVSGCSNSGNISTTNSGAGGIVGVAFNFANVHHNINTATSLTSPNWAAGIIGGYQNLQPGTTYYPYMPAGINPVCDVKFNYSTTTKEQMHGSLIAPYCYTNQADITNFEGNTGADW